MAQKFHFGEFTLDESSYRLQRGDRCLRLEKVPMELLILLVQRHGELISREEIAGHIWGKNVFLDVDHSINTAIRKIRQALHDAPEKPRFLETIIGKGYRFTAPVTLSNANSDPAAQERLSTMVLPVPMAQTGSNSAFGSTIGTGVRSRRLRTIWGVVAVLALGAALAAGVTVWLIRTEYFWQNPIAGARFQTVTDWDGVEQAASVSRDGHFVTFLSNRDGQTDVWITIGQRMASSSHITPPVLEIHYLCRAGACNWGAGLSSPRLPGFTPISRCGRQTESSFTSFRVLYRTNWTSGVSLLRVELPNASHRTIRL